MFKNQSGKQRSFLSLCMFTRITKIFVLVKKKRKSKMMNHSPICTSTLGSQFHALRSNIILHNLAQTKISHFCSTSFIKKNIPRLQIIMYNLLWSLIQIYKATKYLANYTPCFFLWKYRCCFKNCIKIFS